MDTISTKNLNRPAPRWFRRFKKATLILVGTANVMVAQWPTGNEELKTKIQLWCSLGIVSLLEAAGAMLGNGEEYTSGIDESQAEK